MAGRKSETNNICFKPDQASRQGDWLRDLKKNFLKRMSGFCFDKMRKLRVGEWMILAYLKHECKYILFYNNILVFVLSQQTKALKKCWFDVGPLSTNPDQHNNQQQLAHRFVFAGIALGPH